MQFQVVVYSTAWDKTSQLSQIIHFQPCVSAVAVNEVKEIVTTVQRSGTS